MVSAFPGGVAYEVIVPSSHYTLHPQNKTTINRVVSALCFGAVAAASFFGVAAVGLGSEVLFLLRDVRVFLH